MTNRQLTHDEVLEMVVMMKRFGGSFVQALAECFTLADSQNRARLTRAFPKYVKEYTEMAQQDAQAKLILRDDTP